MDNIDELYVGIDLGTTNYSTAIYLKEKVLVLENAEKERIGKSFVFFDNKNDIIMGSYAKRKSMAHGNISENGIYGIKRLIGRKFDDEKVLNILPHLSYIIEEESNEPIIIIEQQNSTFQTTPIEICSIILSNIKNDIIRKFGNIDEIKAVITVPGTFNVTQREAIAEAAKNAGFNVLKLINDTSAIATRYFFEHKRFQDGDHFLICDLGGGTFDISIHKINSTNIETIGVFGDNGLGGFDFDNLIVNYICGILNREYHYHAKLNKKCLLLLIKKCEEAKIALTFLQEYRIRLDDIFPQIDITDIRITRTDFEAMAKIMFKNIMDIIKMCLKCSNLSKRDIKHLILCGGSTKIPKFISLISNYFGSKKLIKFVHPDECLAEGAALQAAMFSTNPSQRLAPIKIVDITTYSIGIRISPYLMRVIIKKNTPIPCNQTTIYSTMRKKQTTCHFDIYEGERPDCRKNRYLTTIKIDNITPAPPGRCRIELMLIIDSSGLLSAFAKELIDNSARELNITYIKAQISAATVKNTLKDAESNKEEDRRFVRFATQKRFLLNYCQTVIRNVNNNKNYHCKKEVYDFCEITYQKAKDFELSDEHKLIDLCHKARAAFKEN